MPLRTKDSYGEKNVLVPFQIKIGSANSEQCQQADFPGAPQPSLGRYRSAGCSLSAYKDG